MTASRSPAPNAAGSDHGEARTLKALREMHGPSMANLAGALCLIPANLHKLARLGTLANLVLSGHAHGRRPVTRTRARVILNERLGDWVGPADDPWPNVATESFIFHGGGFSFIPSEPDTLFTLRALTSAITASDLPAAFVNDVVRVIQGIALLSDTLLRRVDQLPNESVPRMESDVLVPPEADLRRVMRAARLSSDDIAGLLERTSMSLSELHRFSTNIQSRPLVVPPYDATELARRPLCQDGDELIVVAPHQLARALVMRIADLAREAGLGAPVAEAFHHSAFQSLDGVLVLKGLHRISARVPLTEPQHSRVTHAFYQCDLDKIQHIMFASDALRDALDVRSWSVSELGAEYEAAVDAVTKLQKPSEHAPETRSLVVTAAIGRNAALDEAETLTADGFPAADLECIALVEKRDPGLLWKFQTALRDLRATTAVFAWSLIDVYSLWKERQRRFFHPNEDMPTTLSLLPDFGEPIRREAVLRLDRRALPAPDPTHTVEVVRAFGRDEPIYLRRQSSRTRIELAIVTAGPVVWVICDSALDGVLPIEPIWLVRMLAFWISEFARALPESFAKAGLQREAILVELEPVTVPDSDKHAAPFSVKFLDGIVRVRLHSQFQRLDETNRTERELAAEVVVAVLSSTGRVIGALEDVMASLDVVAPLGVKRMQHSFDTSQHPAFIGAAQLPEARYVQDADAHSARLVASGSPTTAGQTLRGEAAKMELNAAVGRLYERLRHSMAAHRVESVSNVLLRYEALVHSDALRDMTFASQLACARDVEVARRELAEEIGGHARAAVATRFLIEHLSAETPSGTRMLSDGMFDEWLATASEIVSLGVASDVIEFGLAEVSVRQTVLGFVLDMGGFDAAALKTRASVNSARIERELRRTRVPGIGRSSDSTPRPPEVNRLDIAMHAEFGHGLDELLAFFGEALALAQENGGTPFVRVARPVLIQHCAHKLAWPEAKVQSCLDLHSLAPRKAFLTPPRGYEKPDLWPWRFNRALSYLRKPFVRLPSDDVCFTPGHLGQCLPNLLHLCTSGKLKARSHEMKRTSGYFTNAESRAFVEQVADTLRMQGFAVRTHAKKFERLSLRGVDGKDLGDVDVLAVDAAKRRILVLECKDFELDRVPHEASDDLRVLFVDSPTSLSAQTKHLRRVDWISANAAAVASAVTGRHSAGEWKIIGAIVLSVALTSALLRKARLPIWTLRDLTDGQHLAP